MGILEQLAKSWPPADWGDATVLLAVSGGADSVALLRAIAALKSRYGGSGRLVVAHFNHRFRAAESDEDQAFVRELSRRLQLECATNLPRGSAVAEGSTPANRGAEESATQPWEDFFGGDDSFPGGELEGSAGKSAGDLADDEDSARQVRYAFFAAEASRYGARYVATAHTADDQAETVLHRVIRGTGLDGLAGIPRFRELLPGVTLIRPLLKIRRDELRSYLAELEQPFRDDSSNASLRYTRNRLRVDLLPRIEREYNGRVREALCRLAELAREAQQFTAQHCEEQERSLIVRRGDGEVSLDGRTLARMPPYLARQLLVRIWDQQRWPRREMSRARWEQLLELTAGAPLPGHRLSLPGKISAVRDGPYLTLVRDGGAGPRPSHDGKAS